jgi:hypothetical protein
VGEEKQGRQGWHSESEKTPLRIFSRIRLKI